MKTLLILAALILASAVSLSGQAREEFQLRSGLSIEYTGAPGSLDLIAMFERYDDPGNDWSTVRPYVSRYKFYQGQFSRLLDPALSQMIGPNHREALLRNVPRIINRNFERPIAVEVGAMKHHTCLSIPESKERSINDAVNTWWDITMAGGYVDRLDVDNAIGHCGSSIMDSAAMMADWTVIVDKRIRDLVLQATAATGRSIKLPCIAFIEAYPFHPVMDHRTYLQRVNIVRGRRGHDPICTYFLDIDHVRATDYELRSDVPFFAAVAKHEKAKFGVIINGDDEDPAKPWTHKDLEYNRSAAVRLARFHRLRMFDVTDIIMIQSWAQELNGSKSVPRNLSEDNVSLTNFVLHTLRCLVGRSECGVY